MRRSGGLRTASNGLPHCKLIDPGLAQLAFSIDIPGDVRALQISPSGRHLAVATAEGQVLTLDPWSASPSWHACATGRRCRSLAWSPDEERLATEVDGQLLVGPVGADLRSTGAAADATSMVWWKDDTIAVTTPLTWPPVALYAPTGIQLGVLEPTPRAVSNHSPRLAGNQQHALLAFSYVQDAVSVFDASSMSREIPPPTVAVPSDCKLTHHLQFSADGTRVALASAPAKSDTLTEVRIADLATSTFLAPVCIPATAALAFGARLDTGFSAPIGASQVTRWSTTEAPSPFCTTREPIWGMKLQDQRLWIWGRRILSLIELVSLP